MQASYQADEGFTFAELSTEVHELGQGQRLHNRGQGTQGQQFGLLGLGSDQIPRERGL